jgi:two-component system sensor histidine kinase ArlS
MSLKMNENKKERLSIVFKLNTWHLSQVFLSFLWINILLICLFTGALFYHAELTIADRAGNIPVQEYILEKKPSGIRLPGFLNGLFPEHMRGAFRQFRIDYDEWYWKQSGRNESNPLSSGLDTLELQELPFWRKLPYVKYRVWAPVPYRDTYFAVDYDMGIGLEIFLKLFIVLAFFELLFFFRSIGKGARAMRRALQPLSDLARTARSINQSRMVQPDAHLRDLTGAIDTINITQLNRRISISSEDKELKELASAINGMLDRIDGAYRSQIRFVSDASHELRTPISVIQGYANLLDRWGKKDEKALQESIDAIKGEAESMKELVEQLLFLARGDNDSMKLNMEIVDLSRITEEVVRETCMIDENHKFITKVQDDVYTVGDAQLIKQAIRIFVDNSIKYTPPGEPISVSAAMEGDVAKVSVQDSGIGISPEDLPHIFDRFFRSDNSRARKTGGTGLGLSIAKWILDRHNAEVEVLSREDLGTRITISMKGQPSQAVTYPAE